MLDGDTKGLAERQRYINDFGINPGRICTISDLLPVVKVIEDLLDDEALAAISTKMNLSKPPNKNQIRQFFQEHLASDELLELGNGFFSKTSAILDELAAKLETAEAV